MKTHNDITSATVLSNEYNLDQFIGKTMATGDKLHWVNQLAGDMFAYVQGDQNLQETIALGFATDAESFKPAFIEVYTNAAGLDENGFAVKKMKNTLDRAMKLIGSPLTVNRATEGREKGKFVWTVAAKRKVAIGNVKPYSKGLSTQAKLLAKQNETNRVNNAAAFLAEAGFTSDSVEDVLEALLDLETLADS